MLSFKQLAQLIILSLVTGLAILLYWSLYDKPTVGIDDSNIYFVYAKNLVNGHGLVYNIGGERVEGYTSTLWLLIISLFYYLFNNYELVLIAFSGLIIIFALFRLIRVIDKINGHNNLISPSAYFLIGVLVLVPGYFDWTIITIMETGLWSVLIVLFVSGICSSILKDRISQRRWYFALLTALLVITRPESLLWAPVFIAIIFILSILKNKSIKDSIRVIMPAAILFGVTLGALTAFRLYYFGYPLPNTYYAKVSSDTFYNIYQGIRYISRACIKLPFLFIVIVGVSYSTILLLKLIYKEYKFKKSISLSQSEQIQSVFTIVSLVGLAIPILTGGDHFHMARFYQPYFPIFLAVFLNIKFWKKHLPVRSISVESYQKYIVVTLLLLFCYAIPKVPLHDYVDVKSPIDHEFRLAELGRANGERLNQLFSGLRLPDIGVSAAGGFAYTYKGQTVDLMGLNNVAMAHAISDKKGVKNHAAFNKTTFFELDPEVFHAYKKISFFIENDSIGGLLEDSGHKSYRFVNNMYKDLMDDEDFISTYFPVIVDNNDLIYTTYMHRDYIKYLKKEGIDVKIRTSEKREDLKLFNMIKTNDRPMIAKSVTLFNN